MATLAELLIKIDTVSANQNLKNLEKNLKTSSTKMMKMGAKMSLITAPITAFGVGAVRSFAKFDDSMTKSTAIMGNLSDKMMGQLKDQAMMLSNTLPISANEMAESYYFLASAGLSAEQSLKALPVVANFATAGAFDMALATDLLTDAQSALGLTVDDAAKNLENMTYISDIFVKGATLANTSVQQLSEAITTTAGTAMNNFNIATEDGVAVLLAFADKGIKANLAGSTYGRMLTLLGNATIENSEQFEKLGVSVFDSAGDFRAFEDVIGDLDQAFAGMGTEAKLAQLQTMGFSALTAKAVLPLLGTADAIKKYKEQLASAGGTTQDVVDKQLKSLSAQAILLKNNFTNLAISLGATLEPQIRKLIAWTKGAVEKFQNMSESSKKLIVAISGIAIAIGPALMALGGIGRGVSVLTGTFRTLKIVMGLANAGILSTLGILAVKFAAVAAVGLVLYGVFKEIKVMWGEAFPSDMGDSIEDAGNQMDISVPKFEVFKAVLQGIASSAIALGRTLARVTSMLVNLVTFVVMLNKAGITDFGKLVTGKLSLNNSDILNEIKTFKQTMTDDGKAIGDAWGDWYEKAKSGGMTTPDIIDTKISDKLSDDAIKNLEKSFGEAEKIVDTHMPEVPAAVTGNVIDWDSIGTGIDQGNPELDNSIHNAEMELNNITNELKNLQKPNPKLNKANAEAIAKADKKAKKIENEKELGEIAKGLGMKGQTTLRNQFKDDKEALEAIEQDAKEAGKGIGRTNKNLAELIKKRKDKEKELARLDAEETERINKKTALEIKQMNKEQEIADLKAKKEQEIAQAEAKRKEEIKKATENIQRGVSGTTDTLSKENLLKDPYGQKEKSETSADKNWGAKTLKVLNDNLGFSKQMVDELKGIGSTLNSWSTVPLLEIRRVL